RQSDGLRGSVVVVARADEAVRRHQLVRVDLMRPEVSQPGQVVRNDVVPAGDVLITEHEVALDVLLHRGGVRGRGRRRHQRAPPKLLSRPAMFWLPRTKFSLTSCFTEASVGAVTPCAFRASISSWIVPGSSPTQEARISRTCGSTALTMTGLWSGSAAATTRSSESSRASASVSPSAPSPRRRRQNVAKL